jgi:OOP family OmpA-OmpF porin
MARVMLGMPGRKVAVLGHTDADGSRPANLALSLARAQAVKDHLVAQKVPADLVDTQGVGPDQPVASNATPEGRARNRRIEFRVLPQ